MNKRRAARRGLIALIALVGLGTGLLAVAQVATSRAAAGHLFYEAAAVPARPVAIVFGAGLYPDGSPTPMLADRVAAAVELYRQGTVSHLLLSGDNSRTDYDEPTTMRRLALNAGVPAGDVTLDYAGFSTSESCARAARVFGVKAAVVVTQDFHIGRVVQLCRAEGIDTAAFAQSSDAYGWGSVQTLRAREGAARVKALWATLHHPEPTFLGPFEGLAGSSVLPPTNQLWDDHLRLS